MKQKFTTGTITRIGVLGAIAAILYAIPGIPIIGFYKLDFSTLPALFGGLALGPLPGFLIVLIKDLTGLMHSSSQGVGDLADLLVSGAFVIVASMVYQRMRTRKGALIGMAWGIVAMVITGALANYYIMIPFYITVMGFAPEKIIGMMAAMVPAIDSIEKVIVLATMPFNLLKGVLLAGITYPLYKPLSPLLHGKKE